MLNSKTLNEVVKDPKKALFLSKAKINLTFCDIDTIDDVPKTFHKIEKLHLSHNKISSLSGIQQFKNITHLSLSYNQLNNWEELLKITNKKALLELNIKGNPLTAHPNHLFLIMDKFPNLQRIDDLKISTEDRYYLRNYWLLSGKVLPFFIQVKNDLEVIEENLQRMKLTAEIRQQRDKTMSITERKDNIQKLEELFTKMLNDLKNDQFLVDVHRIVEKYSKFQSQSPTLTLRIIDTIIQTLYENRLEHLVFERKTLYVSYRKLFNDLMLRYFSLHDTSIDRFLTQQVLETPSYDHWKFAEDNDYAFDCVIYEFYRLMPNQASISHTLNFTFHGNETERETEKAWQNPKDKVITSLDVDPDHPDFLRNTCITHFPLFPLNLHYNNMVLKTLIAQLEVIENVAFDIYMLLDANSPVLKNLGNYRLYIESRRTDRARSQTPPDYREISPEPTTLGRSGRLAASLPSGKRGGSGEHGSTLRSMGMMTSDRKQRSLYLIPSDRKEAQISFDAKSRSISPSARHLDSEQKRLSSTFMHTHRLAGIRSPEEKDRLMKRKNVLPLLLIANIDTKIKLQLKEAFFNIRRFAKSQRKIERKIFVNEFYTTIKGKMDSNIKMRILHNWYQLTQEKARLAAELRRFKRKRLARYFRIFELGVQRSQQEMTFYYMKNLALKTFYSILNLKMRKREKLGKVLEKLVQKQHRILNLHLSKWRLVNSAMKYAHKKTITTKTISNLLTMRKANSASDSRKYKDLKEEALRLQSKKTLRELEPYFRNDRDIFRKCSACDYDM